ncbi:hypothetical protein HAX54_052295 [Datura stramonium]|uniref:Uncharacterized protein n=1 Tax=Datura stramonium TaxID=4076 RepID=A0ABS8WND9_DATST|nr:hypothetical protein [Datura stramonium]
MKIRANVYVRVYNTDQLLHDGLSVAPNNTFRDPSSRSNQMQIGQQVVNFTTTALNQLLNTLNADPEPLWDINIWFPNQAIHHTLYGRRSIASYEESIDDDIATYMEQAREDSDFESEESDREDSEMETQHMVPPMKIWTRT